MAKKMIPAQFMTGTFICPLAGNPKISSGYPKRNNSFGEVIRVDGTYPSGPGTTKPADHEGLDYAVPVGTDLFASDDGTIVRADETDVNGYGRQIRLWLPGKGVTTVNGHLSVMDVKPGQAVVRGEYLGKTGGAKGAPGSGRSGGPHLHFECQEGKSVFGRTKTLDPRGLYKKFATA